MVLWFSDYQGCLLRRLAWPRHCIWRQIPPPDPHPENFLMFSRFSNTLRNFAASKFFRTPACLECPSKLPFNASTFLRIAENMGFCPMTMMILASDDFSLFRSPETWDQFTHNYNYFIIFAVDGSIIIRIRWLEISHLRQLRLHPPDATCVVTTTMQEMFI